MTTLVLPPNLRHESVALLEELATAIVKADFWILPSENLMSSSFWQARFAEDVAEALDGNAFHARRGLMRLAVRALHVREILDRKSS